MEKNGNVIEFPNAKSPVGDGGTESANGADAQVRGEELFRLTGLASCAG